MFGHTTYVSVLLSYVLPEPGFQATGGWGDFFLVCILASTSLYIPSLNYGI